MKGFRHTIIVIGMLTLLSACTGQIFSHDSLMAPWPARMGRPAESSPPAHKQGWYDGCYTGLSTMNQLYYKHFYAYKQDVTMVDNPLYYKAWKDAYTYCRQYSFRYTWDSFDRRRGGGPLSSSGQLCVLCPNEFNR